MTQGIRAEQTIPARSLIWLSIGICLAVAPLALFLPPWLPLWTLALTSWRVFAAWRRAPIPPTWVRMLLFFGGVGGVWVSSGGVFLSVDGAVALLCVLVGLKVGEIRSLRDYLVSVFVGFFLLLSVFFYDQSLLTITYGILPSLILLSGSAQTTSGRITPMPWHAAVKTGVSLLLLALPLTAVFFLFFPRVEGRFVLRFGQARGGVTGMSDQMEPGSVSSITMSQDIAFRADFPDGNIPEPKDRYWRGVVLTRCDGFSWKRGRVMDTAGSLKPPVGPVIRQSITIEPHQRNWLFALDRPIEIGERLQLKRDQSLWDPEPVTRTKRYGVRSNMGYRLPKLEEREIRSLLTLPEVNDPQVTALAAEWARQGGGDVRATVDLALGFFQKQFLYTVTPGTYEGPDGMRRFLFERRRGFCEHYAAAFATLMRMAGIPSRVVLGYQGGIVNRHGGYLTIRQADAHAWAEVWSGTEGWIRVDPTSVVAPDRLEFGMESFSRASEGVGLDLATRRRRLQNADEGRIAALMRNSGEMWDNLNHQWNQFVVDFDGAQQEGLARYFGVPRGQERKVLGAILLAGVLLIGGISSLWILRRKERRDWMREAASGFCDLLRPYAGKREPWEPLTEYAERATREMEPPAAAAVRGHAQLHSSERYGTRPPNRAAMAKSLATLRTLLASAKNNGRHPPGS